MADLTPQLGPGTLGYEAAVDRNIGWLTTAEQQVLRARKVAIAGLGGVGGSHLLTLTRLGVGAFHIADLDVFERVNFNRQAGATTETLGRPKVQVLAEMARAINPELALTAFPEGVTEANLDAFLEGVDLFVDGFDFFEVDMRARTFARCAELGVPSITAAPLGMGTAWLVFLPGQMTFEEYFRLEGLPTDRKYVSFLAGLAPKGLHRGYLVDPSRVDLAGHRGPSTAMGCELAAGVACTEALKVLLGRGGVSAAPWHHQFDAYTGRYRRGRLRWGNRGPVQRLKLALGSRMLARMAAAPSTASPRPLESDLERILDLARWAPSGDNMQTWRFRVTGPDALLVHAWDTREHCVYDLRGRASQLAVGALLETLSLAATRYGHRATIGRVADLPESRLDFRVTLSPDPQVTPDPLVPFIPVRATQRRPMSTRPLTDREKAQLAAAVGERFAVHWLEGRATRVRVARLLALNAKLRLTLPEAYETHRAIIEWDAQFSEDRIPDRAIGLDPVGTKLMRWAMASWRRVDFLNRYLAGTAIPRLQLDLLPGIACAAHYLLVPREPARTVDDYIDAGRAWQRLWLTATKLGLWSQPEMTPLIFYSYVREGVEFTRAPGCRRLAERLATRLEDLLTPDLAARAVVLARIGAGPAPTTRSLRLPLERLLVSKAPDRTRP
jgi:molybdopterin/thiamine biosynthesis adenylyltransferase